MPINTLKESKISAMAGMVGVYVELFDLFLILKNEKFKINMEQTPGIAAIPVCV